MKHRAKSRQSKERNSNPTPEWALSPPLKKDLPLQPNQWDIGAMKLWSRALLRSYVEDGNALFWAFLPKEDFQKTNQSASILPALVADMGAVMALPPLRVILWQDEDSAANTVRVLLTGTDTNTIMKMAQATETPVTNGNLVLSGFTNFSEAEVEIRKLLKDLRHEVR